MPHIAGSEPSRSGPPQDEAATSFFNLNTFTERLLAEIEKNFQAPLPRDMEVMFVRSYLMIESAFRPLNWSLAAILEAQVIHQVRPTGSQRLLTSSFPFTNHQMAGFLTPSRSGEISALEGLNMLPWSSNRDCVDMAFSISNDSKRISKEDNTITCSCNMLLISIETP